MNRQRGMTLVELLVSMAIVLVVTGAATGAYLKLLRSYKTQSKVSENYMTNVSGLELLRYDIEMAGFGLPANVAAVPAEANAVAVNLTVIPPAIPNPYDPATLNDSKLSNPTTPHAFVILNRTASNGSAVLAIKSAAAGIINNAASKKWAMLSFPNATPMVRGGTADFAAGDNFIVLDNSGNLIPANDGTWYRTFDTAYYNNFNVVLNPALTNQNIYYIYGLASNTAAYNMPFNRVDYYLNKVKADTPNSCAAGTSTLYRATIAPDGSRNLATATPLIDCVQDFQVAFGLSSPPPLPLTWQSTLAGTDSSRVREVRVFLIVQEGTGDTGKNATFRFSGTLNLGDQDIANALDPADFPVTPNNFQQWTSTAYSGAPQLNAPGFTPTVNVQDRYRWKVLQMAVKPMNLK